MLFRWQSRVFKISYVSGIFLYGEIYNVTKLDNLGALPSLDEFAERLGISFVVQEHNTTTELAADSAVSYLNTFKFSNNVLFTLNSYDDCCDNELEYLLD